jgi:hypothetical protein
LIRFETVTAETVSVKGMRVCDATEIRIRARL